MALDNYEFFLPGDSVLMRYAHVVGTIIGHEKETDEYIVAWMEPFMGKFYHGWIFDELQPLKACFVDSALFSDGACVNVIGMPEQCTVLGHLCDAAVRLRIGLSAGFRAGICSYAIRTVSGEIKHVLRENIT